MSGLVRCCVDITLMSTGRGFRAQRLSALTGGPAAAGCRRPRITIATVTSVGIVTVLRIQREVEPWDEGRLELDLRAEGLGCRSDLRVALPVLDTHYEGITTKEREPGASQRAVHRYAEKNPVIFTSP